MLIGLCITLGLRFQLKSLGEVSGKIWGGALGKSGSLGIFFSGRTVLLERFWELTC